MFKRIFIKDSIALIFTLIVVLTILLLILGDIIAFYREHIFLYGIALGYAIGALMTYIILKVLGNKTQTKTPAK